MAARPVHLVVSLTGLEAESGDVQITHDHVFRVELPDTIDSKHVELLRRDCEIMAGVAMENPGSLMALHEAAVKSDFRTARRLVDELGLREERFYAEGGGMWGWIVVAAVALAAAAAFSGDSPSPPQPPPQPPPEPTPLPDGGADAGPG
jgi:hypothetical protein